VFQPAPVRDIADLLGQRSLTITRRSAHLRPSKLCAVAYLLGSCDMTTDVAQSRPSVGVL
jgi:hypothetical protein